MDISDLKNKVTEAIEDRIRNPFLGSIVLAWPIINYKLLLVVFGDGGYEEKLLFIEKKLYTSWLNGFWVHVVLLPILAGLFFVLVYPEIDRHLTKIVVKRAQKKERELLLIEQKKPVDEKYQAEFFASWNSKTQAQKAAIEHTNSKYRELSAESAKRISLLEERLTNQTLLKIAHECGAGAEEAEFLKNIHDENQEWMHRGKKLFLQRHPQFNALRSFQQILKTTPSDYDTALRILRTDWLCVELGLDKKSMPEFLETLSALKIIKDLDEVMPDQIFVSLNSLAPVIENFFTRGWEPE